MHEVLRSVSKHELAFDIKRVLSKARGLWPRDRRGGDALAAAARAVAEHLELCWIRCFWNPPRAGYGTPPGFQPGQAP